MYKALFVVALSLVFSPIGFSFDQAQLRDQDHILLNIEQSVIEFRYDYPGLGKDENGRSDYDQSDCLRFSMDVTDENKSKMKSFFDRLTIWDGPGILFGEADGVFRMKEKDDNGSKLFFLNDLGVYVTGIRISTVNKKSIKSLVETYFPNESHSIYLSLHRNCKFK